MRRNQNFEKVTYVFRLFRFLEFFFRLSFFSFSFLFSAVIDLLLGLLAVKKLLRKRHRDGQFLPWSSHGLSFSLNFLNIFVHISGSIRPITLIWASLARSFPPAEVEYRWCQLWSKVMTSEVEEMPRLITAGYGQYRSQWVKQIIVKTVVEYSLGLFLSFYSIKSIFIKRGENY